MVNPNWVRWIHASVAKYLKDICDDEDYVSLVEGLEERTDEFQRAPNRVEIRISGPFTREQNDGSYEAIVFINVLVTNMLGGKNDDAYMADRMLGVLHAAMDEPIPLKKYGPDNGMGGIDDSSLFACLRTIRDKKNSLRVIHFGQFDPKTRQKQGMVDGSYKTVLTN